MNPDIPLQQLWEAYSTHEGRKLAHATRGIVTAAHRSEISSNFHNLIDTIKADAWDEGAGSTRDIHGDVIEPNPYRYKYPDSDVASE